jgi:hypothetical protein
MAGANVGSLAFLLGRGVGSRFGLGVVGGLGGEELAAHAADLATRDYGKEIGARVLRAVSPTVARPVGDLPPPRAA